MERYQLKVEPISFTPALSCAQGIEGLKHTIFFSVGSDGTDGPTDPAGGIADERQQKDLEGQVFHWKSTWTTMTVIMHWSQWMPL